MTIQEKRELIETVLQRNEGRGPSDDTTLWRDIYATVAEVFSGSKLSVRQREAIARKIHDSMRGMDILQPLIDDPSITEIMVNGAHAVFIEKQGCIEKSSIRFEDEAHLLQVIHHSFGRANRQIHEQNPMADMRLESGARVHAILPPIARNGAVLCIRKFTGLRPDMPFLIEHHFLTREAADYLIESVRKKRTVFICGGTGSGKTTFLNILSNYIPAQERILTIEDSAELNLQQQPNWVRLEARQTAAENTKPISLTDLIRSSLRLRPDRIIVGEVRGTEAFDMLQAMNTGHPGSLCTGHANSCQDMLARLSLMVLMAVQLPWEAIRGLIASALDLIVFLRRDTKGKRQIVEISWLNGVNKHDFDLQPVFRLDAKGGLVHANPP